MTQKEIWKDVPGYEGIYTVSNFGKVFSYHKKRVLKATKNGQGYPAVTLCDGHSQKIFRVHRLVAELFIPNPDNKPYINHIDSDRANNMVNNLEWCTQKENINHAIKLGRFNTSGTANGQNKLSESDVKYIFSSKEPQSKLAKRFGVHQSTISLLMNKKRWKSL